MPPFGLLAGAYAGAQTCVHVWKNEPRPAVVGGERAYNFFRNCALCMEVSFAVREQAKWTYTRCRFLQSKE